MNIGSKLTVAKNVVTSKAGRQLLLTQKHSPVILFGAGVVGVVATTVLACKATLKLEAVLDENERIHAEAKERLALDTERYTAKDYTQDSAVLKVRLVRDVTKLYAPAIGLGVVSICALGGSHFILSKRNAGLVAAYAALDKGFNEYRERVIKMVGPEKERELLFESETREVAVDGKNGVEVVQHTSAIGPSRYAKFFSKETSSIWSPDPGYNLCTLQAQQAFANDKLWGKGHVFLNEVYDSLGLDRTPEGAVVGWVKNNPKGGDNEIDFGIFTDKNRDQFHDFMQGREGALLLDFNVDGVVWDLI